MPAKKYVSVTGNKKILATSVVVSAGVASDGDLVALDPLGKIDTSVLPAGLGANSVTAQASEALAAGDYVNIYDNAGTANVRKADATTDGKPCNGFVKNAFANAALATIFTSGNVNTGNLGLSAGPVFLAIIAGKASNTAPSANGNGWQRLGDAVNATTVSFDPESMITLS